MMFLVYSNFTPLIRPLRSPLPLFRDQFQISSDFHQNRHTCSLCRQDYETGRHFGVPLSRDRSERMFVAKTFRSRSQPSLGLRSRNFPHSFRGVRRCARFAKFSTASSGSSVRSPPLFRVLWSTTRKRPELRSRNSMCMLGEVVRCSWCTLISPLL